MNLYFDNVSAYQSISRTQFYAWPGALLMPALHLYLYILSCVVYSAGVIVFVLVLVCECIAIFFLGPVLCTTCRTPDAGIVFVFRYLCLVLYFQQV